MNYEILEVHAAYTLNAALVEVAVVWQSGNMVRGCYINQNAMSGYRMLNEEDTLSPELIQEVAGYGVSLDNVRKEKYFPEIKNWEN